MISLSNLIKSSAYTPSAEIRRIDINEIVAAMREAAADKQAGSAAAADETEAIREEMLRDAREMAEQMIARAREEAELMKARALEEIEAWWSTRREEDRQVVEEARARGYDEGYAAGKAEAEAAVREQHAGTLAEAKAVLETAVAQKQAIIREAEPFLVELSCSIASKIIGRQLTLEPEWTIDMIKSVLGRRREKGTIALCVSPQQFSFQRRPRRTAQGGRLPGGTARRRRRDRSGSRMRRTLRVRQSRCADRYAAGGSAQRAIEHRGVGRGAGRR